MPPRLLDLFCGAGGAAMGYSRAGFEVVGVDIKAQPRYPFEFVQWDALEFLTWLIDTGEGWRSDSEGFQDSLGRFDAIHASPPCQAYSMLTRVQGVPSEHPDLVSHTRELLRAAGLPYVIENVIGSPLENATTLCGASFGLRALCRDGRWRYLRRHRLFEASFFIYSSGCACGPGEPLGVYGNGGGQAKTVRNGGKNRGYMGTRQERVDAMGIDWMTVNELSEAIPPAYTELIGNQLREFLCAPEDVDESAGFDERVVAVREDGSYRVEIDEEPADWRERREP